MSDERMITQRCDTCKHHKPASWYGEGWCENQQSPYYDFYTFNTAYCKEWEGEEQDETD